MRHQTSLINRNETAVCTVKRLTFLPLSLLMASRTRAEWPCVSGSSTTACLGFLKACPSAVPQVVLPEHDSSSDSESESEIVDSPVIDKTTIAPNLDIQELGAQSKILLQERASTPVPSETALEVTKCPNFMPAMVEEFGPINANETAVASSTCVLFRRVLVQGTMFVTSFRVSFFAVLPDIHSAEPSKPILSSYVVVHHRQRFKKAVRLWLELTPNRLSSYESAKKLDKPHMSALLDRVTNVERSPDSVRSMLVAFRRPSKKDKVITVEFDTEEMCTSWQNSLNMALHVHRRAKDNGDVPADSPVRISIPLRRVKKFSLEEFDGFLGLIQIEFEDSKGEISTLQFGLAHAAQSFLAKVKDAIAKLPPADMKEPEPLLEMRALFEHSPEESVSETDTAAADGAYAEEAKIVFALEKNVPVSVFKCSHNRLLPCNGHLILNNEFICFWRKSPLAATRLRFALSSVKTVKAANSFGFRTYGLLLHVLAHADMTFDFPTIASRDQALVAIQAAMAEIVSDTSSSKTSGGPTTPTRANSLSTLSALSLHSNSKSIEIPASLSTALPHIAGSGLKFSIKPMNVTCLTIGSRGDVAPYIALAQGLMAHGHTVTIATHPEFAGMCRHYGISHQPVGGDPAALMELSAQHAMFSPGWFSESLGQFRVWFDNLLEESYKACVASKPDLIIESPSTFAGIHVAQCLEVAYMRAFTMPWTRTKDFPHAFSPQLNMGAAYNLATYSIFESVIWTASSSQINKFRKNILKIPATTLEKLQQVITPFCYNFSPSIVPVPSDWPSPTYISGYWVISEDDNSVYTPPDGLEDFILKAQQDGKKVVYIGFGSIVVKDAEKMTETIFEAIELSGVRCILSKGWSDRGSKIKSTASETQHPDVFVVKSVEHSWLFPKIDAAMHHGGAGTTAASLRNGLPTLIHPFFGDQNFWAARVQKLGAGVKVNSLSASDISEALIKATTDQVMKEKAMQIGDELRSENGVANAINWIYGNYEKAKMIPNSLARAKTLTTPKGQKSSTGVESNTAAIILEESARL